MSEGKLPEGWVDTQLGNVVEYGKTSKKDLSNVNGNTWVLELEDIEKDSSKLLNKVVASNRPFKSTKNSFKKGDVLYGKLRPYLNKIIIANDDGVCSTEIIPMNAEPTCCNKYLFFWLKSSTFLGYVSDVSYGVNMPRLGTSDGLKAPLRLAPLAEQKIIAEKLDALLAQVDSTKARLEKIPKILKRFRQAVIATSISGTLSGQDEKCKSIKVEDFWSHEVIGLERWQEYTFSDVVKIIGGSQPPKAEFKYEEQDGYIRLIQIRDYRSDNYKVFIPLTRAKRFVEKNDVMIGRYGPPIFQILRGLEGAYNVALMKAVPKAEVLDNDYLYWFLKNYKLYNFIEAGSDRTAGQSGVNKKHLESYPVILPPIHEQQEIVRRVEQLFAYADTIEKQVNNALARVNNLTQSILAKAFRGELTAQWRAENPELISGENSAAALLEKIKAERAASTGKKASRKKS